MNALSLQVETYKQEWSIRVSRCLIGMAFTHFYVTLLEALVLSMDCSVCGPDYDSWAWPTVVLTGMSTFLLAVAVPAAHLSCLLYVQHTQTSQTRARAQARTDARTSAHKRAHNTTHTSQAPPLAHTTSRSTHSTRA